MGECWKDNWFFERREDGSVRIYHEDLEADQEEDFVEYDVCLDIDPAAWASIIASVSSRGAGADNFQIAQSFHMGGPPLFLGMVVNDRQQRRYDRESNVHRTPIPSPPRTKTSEDSGE